MMTGYKRDGTLEYICDQFEFGACPNPLCKKFKKPFQSKRLASSHFGQPCKSECTRIINSNFNFDSDCDDKKVADIPTKKRLKVDMPDDLSDLFDGSTLSTMFPNVRLKYCKNRFYFAKTEKDTHSSLTTSTTTQTTPQTKLSTSTTPSTSTTATITTTTTPTTTTIIETTAKPTTTPTIATSMTPVTPITQITHNINNINNNNANNANNNSTNSKTNNGSNDSNTSQ